MICTLCGTDVAEDAAAAIAMKLDAATTSGQWEAWADYEEGRTWDTPAAGRGLFQLTLVARASMKDINGSGYSEEFSQGSEFKLHLIVAVGGYLLRKDGTADSYGSESWNGALRPVRVGQRLVKVFEDVKP